MRRFGTIRSRLSLFSVLVNSNLKLGYVKPTLISNSSVEPSSSSSLDFGVPFSFSSFSTSSLETSSFIKVEKSKETASCCNTDSDADDGDGDDSKDVDESVFEQFGLKDGGSSQDAETIWDILKGCGNNRVEMKNRLEQCSVKASSELVTEILSRARNDWETAFTFFLWAQKQPGYYHSLREYHMMISILGKMRKFDTAWAVIDEMRRGRLGESLLTPQTLLIMIRRYCAVHDVGRAINTFYAYKRFKFDVGIDEFQSLLSALCRYKNVQDAEHLMFCNKDVYPFNTKSFNIILNGWCNIIGSPREAERIWREMGKRGIQHDVVSFASIISCYSKSNNLNKVLKLFSQMKKLMIEPDRKVYNAVTHALAKGRFVTEAINLLKTMEEKGIAPNIVTYNSLIKPLCKARKIDEAGKVFDEMLQRGLSPTILTYHAFMRVLRTGEEVFGLLEKMRKTGCEPVNDTYIMLIRKFCRWRQFDNVFRLWNELCENGIGPDRSSYIVLIHGLFFNGKLEEAYKYYMEMKGKHLLPEPKIEEMLQDWMSGKQTAAQCVMDLKDSQCSQLIDKTTSASKKFHTDFLRQAETRRVVRERGFSFWEQ
ncbi:pentatricopeptide repeat-containing protein At5g15010, mitochondrial [Carica papaya]|uniref:pentatricopeptide repeat-containing protein At5g15010, mitochondrial n=1 Tax=Carica papaya TaxID=3649 RepID=UPI000B8C977E|nr:pentatricopeptide repeat-containing protein At5g15010, mitochondrial [Carica papaya]